MNNTQYKACIADCTATANVSRQCTHACLQEADLKKLLACIQLTNDCTHICELAVKYMLADSAYVKQACKLCADICHACAIECEKHAHMEHCALCARDCRACAIVCLEMSKN
jgi:hypothetical protein